MSLQQNYNSDLGDIARVLDTKDVVNLDWLEVTPGEDYDNIPSESPREVIPQLQEQWNTEQYSSPFKLVPNSAAPQGSAGRSKAVGEDDIFEVARVAKKAMMQGLKGPEVLSHLRERFSSEELMSASGELKKVASEEGLLGNVYIDLSPFRTSKEAALQLGKHKVRLASFVVGAPYHEKNFVDTFGKCRHLNKTAVDKVEYTGEVLAHYATHLKNAGIVAKTASINSKEDLRLAFLTSRSKKAESLVPAGEADQPDPINEDNINQAMASMHAIKSANEDKIAADVRIARVRPILAKVQDAMLQGHTGCALKDQIRANLDTSTIQEFAPEIGAMVKRQGIIGPLTVDVSTYPTVDGAAGAISKSFMKPKFISSSLPVDDGFMDKVKTRTGLPILTPANMGDITPKMAADIISTLHDTGKISSEAAVSLLASAKKSAATILTKQADGSLEIKASTATTPMAVIEAAMAQCSVKKATKEVKMANTQQGHVYSSVTSDRPKVDRMEIKTAATASFAAGLSAESVEARIANYVPVGEAIGIVREAMAAMDLVSADSLDKCQTEKYPVSKKASLIATGKCGGCVRNVCGTCSKQGLTFKRANTKVASTQAPSVDPAISMGMTSSPLQLDMSSIIIPARKNSEVSMGPTSLGDLPT